MNPFRPATLSDLKSGDHVAFLYSTEDEHRAVMEQFLREGLERGQKVVYVAETHSPKSVSNYLGKAGFDIKPYLSCGQLVVQGPEETYLRDGVFDPDGVIALLMEETERAVAQGYAGLRATGEMSWALREPPGCERLIEYEAELSDFCAESQLLALCQYDQKYFGSDILLDILQTHRSVILGTELCHNFYYFPSAALTGHSLPAARYDTWALNLLKFRRIIEGAREAIRSREEKK